MLGASLIFNDLPQLDQRRLVVSEVNLESNAICVFNNSLDRRFLDTSARQFYLDIFPRFELSIWHFREEFTTIVSRGAIKQ